MSRKLMTAEQLRKLMGERYAGHSHEDIGEMLGLSGGFVGMVLKGSREPSKKFLRAVGAERVTFYREVKP